MVSVDYDYYTTSYYGDLISEDEFPKFIKRAEPYVSARTFGSADEVEDTDTLANKVKDCLCGVAELLKSYTDDDGIAHGAVKSESVGGSWSRNYGGTSDGNESIEDIINNKIYIMLSNTGLLYAGGM